MTPPPHHPDVHHRRSIRIPGYDYASPGAYFVTISVQDSECVLGQVVDGEMVLSEAGQIAHDGWAEVPRHFPNVSVDTFVVMPNHVHGIVCIEDDPGRGGVTPPLQDGPHIVRPTLGQIVAYYKYRATKWINALRDTPGAPFWQRNYYERIIRDDAELDRIREYIVGNPYTWHTDRDNPDRIRDEVL